MSGKKNEVFSIKTYYFFRISGLRIKHEMENIDKQSHLPAESIIRKIYWVRGEKVMLDEDLAELYGVEVKRLKEAVRRNIHRFPADFVIELTWEEYHSLRSQFAFLKRGKHSKFRNAHEFGKARLRGFINKFCLFPSSFVILRLQTHSLIP